MIIKSIKLTNFRNYKNHHYKCDDNISLIIGKNGSGKTSILEAIYILMRGKSFRATDNDILNWDSDFYRIELQYSKGEKIIKTFDGNLKNFQITDQKTKTLPKKFKYPIVLFLPSDLNLIHHSPGSRREYFDKFFSELDESYHQNLLKYQKALKQRNEILKSPHPTKKQTFSWDILLVKYGTELYQARQKYTNKINSLLTQTYQSIAGTKDIINLQYSTEIDEKTYLKNLEVNFEKDQILKHTSYGVHHDDYIFKINHKKADTTASRGETRSIILALKFIEAKLIYQTHHKHPLILLDDVFSELDETRRRHLIKNFKDNQIIITSVENLSTDF